MNIACAGGHIICRFESLLPLDLNQSRASLLDRLVAVPMDEPRLGDVWSASSASMPDSPLWSSLILALVGSTRGDSSPEFGYSRYFPQFIKDEAMYNERSDRPPSCLRRHRCRRRRSQARALPIARDSISLVAKREEVISLQRKRYIVLTRKTAHDARRLLAASGACALTTPCGSSRRGPSA